MKKILQSGFRVTLKLLQNKKRVLLRHCSALFHERLLTEWKVKHSFPEIRFKELMFIKHLARPLTLETRRSIFWSRFWENQAGTGRLQVLGQRPGVSCEVTAAHSEPSCLFKRQTEQLRTFCEFNAGQSETCTHQNKLYNHKRLHRTNRFVIQKYFLNKHLTLHLPQIIYRLASVIWWVNWTSDVINPAASVWL